MDPSVSLHADEPQEQADARRDQDAQQHARARAGGNNDGKMTVPVWLRETCTFPYPHSSMDPSVSVHADETQEHADARRDQDAQQHAHARAGGNNHGLAVRGPYCFSPPLFITSFFLCTL